MVSATPSSAPACPTATEVLASCAGDFHEPVFLYPSFPRTAASLPQSAVCVVFSFSLSAASKFFSFSLSAAYLPQLSSLFCPLCRIVSGFSVLHVSCVRRFQRRIVVQSFSARRCPAAIHPLTAACRKRSVAVFCFRRYSAAYPFILTLSSLFPRSSLVPAIYAQYMLNICSIHAHCILLPTSPYSQPNVYILLRNI